MVQRPMGRSYGVTRVTDSITTGVSGTFWCGGRGGGFPPPVFFTIFKPPVTLPHPP